MFPRVGEVEGFENGNKSRNGALVSENRNSVVPFAVCTNSIDKNQSWITYVIGHVLIQLRKEFLVGHGHDGSQTAHLGLGNTVGKDTTVTLRTEGSLCKALLGLNDLGIVGIEHIKLELFDLGIREFRVHVSAAGVLLEVTRIEGIVFEIVLGNVYRGLGSWGDLTNGDRLLSILADHVLIVGVGQLVEVVGIFGPEIEEALDRVKSLGAH